MKLKNLISVSVVFAGISFLALQSSGQTTIASWSFNTDSVTPIIDAANVGVSDLTVSAGSISFQNGTDSGGSRIAFSGSGWNVDGFNPSTNKFWEFTVTPTSGYQIDYNTLSLRVGRTAAGAQAATIQWSLDGFTTAGTTASSFSINSTDVNSLDPVSVGSGNLPAGNVSDSVTFRIFGYDATGTGNFRLNNVAFSGSVSAIPEPSTYAAIGGILALGAVLYRRRKLKAQAEVAENTSAS